MAAVPDEPPRLPAPPTIRRAASPPPDALPTPAVRADGTGSGTGEASLLGFVSRDAQDARDARDARDSLGSDASSSAFSRQSSGSYYTAASSLSASSPTARLSVASTAATTTSSAASTAPAPAAAKRRGYMRPQGTDFAASARSRESVLSLGSIAHLQHYFARTGLLDLKGQLERRRRRGKARTLDLAQLEGTSAHAAAVPRARSMLVETAAAAEQGERSPTMDDFVESPIEDRDDADDDDEDDDWYADYDSADAAAMLPPTVSTYMFREKPLPKPPSLAELKADLKSSLDSAARALAEAREAQASQAGQAGATPASSTPSSPARQPDKAETAAAAAAGSGPTSWYEIQGMHILDVITLAIRAAKVYYTSHENPDRLDTIKPEREVRSELLGVMDVLKRMATRSFVGGVRADELRAMDAWVASLYGMLEAEEALLAAERAERASWTWLQDAAWPASAAADPARAYAREHAFLQSILASGGGGGGGGGDKDVAQLPPWTPMDRSRGADADGAGDSQPPTAFLRHMQNGVCLVQLHNCAVRKSRRRFGAIPTFHADTQKPYRAADNLRYWVKAAELRWEVLLKIDALGVVCSSRPDVWPAFEDAIYQWCRKVREEITAEIEAI